MARVMSSVISSIKNTFLHFDVGFEQSPCKVQPSLERARSMPTPTCCCSADSEEADAAVEASDLFFLHTATESTRSDKSGDAEDTSDAESLQPQPELCRDNTYDTFDGFFGEAEGAAGSRCRGAGDQEDASDAESLGPQPDICRDNTYNTLDGAFSEAEVGQPNICRDTTFDAFDAEDLGDRRAADAERQQAEAKEEDAPAMAWQARPPAAQVQAAPGVGAVVLPGLLPPFLAAPRVLRGAGQPALLLVGVPAAAGPALEPRRPAAEALPASQQAAVRKPVARAEASTSPPSPPPAPGSCALEEDAGALRLRWTVDARKLRKNDRVIVSPLFDLPIGKSRPVPFRLMLFPTKGAGSFRASNGVGTMLLKCEATAQESLDCCLELRFVVGREPPRGLPSHNFAWSGVCSLPEDQQEWNFTRAIDQASQTVGICLEIVRR